LARLAMRAYPWLRNMFTHRTGPECRTTAITVGSAVHTLSVLGILCGCASRPPSRPDESGDTKGSVDAHDTEVRTALQELVGTAEELEIGPRDIGNSAHSR
jgi:hypothetical protein